MHLDRDRGNVILKSVLNLKKITGKVNACQYLSAITDLIKVANMWLAENRPELKREMESVGTVSIRNR